MNPAGGERGLPQLVQPAPDRTHQRIFLGPFDRRRILQRLQQHGGGMLAVPSDRAAATRRQRDGVRIPDLDKDVVGAWPRSVDRSDQALAALIGSQVANRAPALVGTTFLKAPGKATAHVAFIESDGGKRKIVQWRRPVQSWDPPTGSVSLDRPPLLSSACSSSLPLRLCRARFRPQQLPWIAESNATTVCSSRRKSVRKNWAHRHRACFETTASRSPPHEGSI